MRGLLAGLLLAGALLEGTYTAEATPPDSRPTPQWVIDTAREAGARWGANADRMVEVMRCETGGTFDPYTMNRNGLDHGIAQFRVHPSGYSLIQETPYATRADTWRAVYDPVTSIYAMAYLWGQWPGTTGAAHWSCWRILYGR